MPSHTIITEIDADEALIDQKLDQLLDAHDGDPKKLLATTFRFLSGRTRFFDDPEVSKVLARLLRDTKKPAGVSEKPNSNPTAVKPAQNIPVPPPPVTTAVRGARPDRVIDYFTRATS